MEIDPVLIIVVIGSIGGLLIERFFYYRSKYKEKKTDDKIPISVVPAEPENPGYGERIATLEEAAENLEKNNDKDHELIRKDIRKIFNLINGMRK